MQNADAPLTPEQVNFFNQEGYLVVDRLMEDDELAWAREIYDRIFRERAGREAGDEFDLAGPDQEEDKASLPQILSPAKYAPEFLSMKAREKAFAMARQLLGPETQHGGDHAILKPAHLGAETPWHQDEAYWPEDMEHDSLSVWLPFQEATLENGCLHFVPGSHRLPVLPHHPIGNDPRVHGLEVDQADTTGSVACPLAAGGATFHHCRTLHYAGPNRSGGVRRAYIMVFGVPARKLEKPRNFYWQHTRETPREQRAQEYLRKIEQQKCPTT